MSADWPTVRASGLRQYALAVTSPFSSSLIRSKPGDGLGPGGATVVCDGVGPGGGALVTGSDDPGGAGAVVVTGPPGCAVVIGPGSGPGEIGADAGTDDFLDNVFTVAR